MRDGCEKSFEAGKCKGKVHEQLGQVFTNQQFNQLRNLLDHMQVQTGNNISNTTHENLNDGDLNFAGILACYSLISDIGDLSCKCLKLNVDSWIIDSGSTHHMTFNKLLLNNRRPIIYFLNFPSKWL